ncbi:MAG: flagellar filament capping protein FliD [Magnetococcales bacterium]|nr:flagellar filament capping protein FliD [Magnetococcales bacterium]
MAIGNVTISGMASGLPADMVDQLVNAQKTRLKAMERDKTFFTNQQTAVGELETKILALQTKAKELQDTSAWAPHTVTSSNEDYVTATADSTAQAGIHTIQVTQLAKYDTWVMGTGDGFGSATTLGTNPSFTFTYNGTTYDAGATSTMTLADLADAINALDYGTEDGVSASVLNTGTERQLILTAKDSGLNGAADRITAVNFSDGAGTSYAAGQTVAPKNALLTIDGISVTSSSNQVDDALTGVTLNLKELTVAAVNVGITNDKTALKTVLTGFTDAYNAVVDYVTQHKTDTLSGETLARGVLSQMRNVLNTATQNAAGDLSPYSTLASVGLRTDQKTARISFDATSLDTALDNNFNSITKLFTSEDTTGAGFNEGVAHRMADLIDTLTTSTTGAFAGRKDGLKARLDRLEKNIERENDRLDKVRETLTKKFSNLEQMITRMNSSSSSLLSSIQKLNG